MFNFETKPADTVSNDTGELLELAARLTPISELNESNRLTICKSATVVNLNRSTSLTADKEHRWFTFLLDGQVDIQNTKEKDDSESIAPGTDRAAQPLLKEFTSHLVIRTKTTATLVRFGRELFDILLSEQQKNATKVTDVRLSERDNLVFDSIIEAFDNRAVNLVCQAVMGEKIASLVQANSMGIPELSLALTADPALTAHTLYEANKLAGNGETTQTMRGAITRLGVESANQLAVKIPTHYKWQAASPVLEKHMAQYQRRATLTAAICKVFAKSLPHLSDERAHLIGLMSDIGELVILAHANNHPDEFSDSAALHATSKNLREVVGMWLLSSWGYHESFIEAIEAARDFYRNHTGDITYADLVTASLLTIESELPEEENKSIPSVVNLLLPRKLQQAGIDLQNPKQILQEAAGELRNLQSLLS